MDLDLRDFSAVQQRALFNLLIMAMYADGHLSIAEDQQLQILLTAMGHVDESAQQREFDEAVTRIRPLLQCIHQAREAALSLASAFTDRSQQKRVYAAVQQIMNGDNHITSWESTLLSELRLIFRL